MSPDPVEPGTGLAVFDIDGTLVRGVSERQFFRYLHRSGKFGLHQTLAYALFFPRHVAVDGIHTAKRNKAYLYGLHVREIESLARQFAADELPARFYEPIVHRIRRHQDRGDTLLLQSGTLECIARAIGDRFGIRAIQATRVRVRAGRFTAAPPVQHPFGAAKLVLVRQAARELGIGLDRVTAYANSKHDLALLQAVGRPIAVLPDSKLLRTARDRGWEVIGADERERSALKRQAPTDPSLRR